MFVPADIALPMRTSRLRPLVGAPPWGCAPYASRAVWSLTAAESPRALNGMPNADARRVRWLLLAVAPASLPLLVLCAWELGACALSCGVVAPLVLGVDTSACAPVVVTEGGG